MKNLNILTLTFVCSIGSVAFAKQTGTTISIENKNKQGYEKAVVSVAFASLKGNHERIREGFVEVNLKKGRAANLLDAITCRKAHVHRQCNKTVLAEHYGNDASNVDEIYVKSIVVGPENMYATAGGKAKGKASGSFVHSNTPHGTLKRTFVINGHNIEVKN